MENRLAPAAAFSAFIDPDPSPGDGFGAFVLPLSTGNVVVTSPYDDAGGTDAGAVYLFNGATGALISTLTGSLAGDNVGSGDARMLPNGNFLVFSPSWSNGASAVTFCNGSTGLSGVVSAANSLVGSPLGGDLGAGGLWVLTNGNYVVDSPYWSSASASQAGAVTFGSGTTGVSGVVSDANSLVGSSDNDWVGFHGVTPLSNGNYVVGSPDWTNGDAAQAGAVTFGNGTTGVSGFVSAANSLVGSTANDHVGDDNTKALSNGNYVVVSEEWANGDKAHAGAVTFGNGTTGVSGVISAANSLVGASANDQVGSGDRQRYFGSVIVLANDNYVVNSPFWSNGMGAVTFGSGTSGVSGVVSAANSLVGSAANDDVGSYGVHSLSNGNYLVCSPTWSNGEGALTFGSGTSGVTGVVSAANSLVGSSAGDQVGSGYDGGIVTFLANGNYVVASPNWSNGTGAVTFGSGTSGVSGVVSAANSLVGLSAGDQVGSGYDYNYYSGVTALLNGNYVVSSPLWSSGKGAVTFCNGASGTSGVVSVVNSLVGSSPNDQVGDGGVTALVNGNYVVTSPDWSNGNAFSVGAATFGNGTTGVSGVVSAANSLVGSTEYDQVGGFSGYGFVTALANGNYVVDSPYWSNGAAIGAGAVTFGNGTTGVSGVVSAANSLVGSSDYDQVGNFGSVKALPNGNYVVSSPWWSNGAASAVGAVTFGNGATGVSGVISDANSLIGLSDYDQVGAGGVTALSDGNYVVDSPYWSNAATSPGAVTFGDGTSGVSGVVSAANSFVGDISPAAQYLGPVVVDNVNGNYFAAFVGDVVQVASQADGRSLKYDTSVAVASSSTAAVFGQEVTFTATVSSVLAGTGTPTGQVAFSDGSTLLGTATLNGSGQATLLTSGLSIGDHSINASYIGDKYVAASSGAITQMVNGDSAVNLTQVLDATGSITIQTATDSDAHNVIKAVNGLPSYASNPLTVTVNLAAGSYSDLKVSPPAGVTLVITGAGPASMIVGNSAALKVTSGTVIVSDVSLTTATNSPTVTVTGGSLTLRNDTVEESTGFSQAAISITGGLVDLGNWSDPGNNTIAVNGSGLLIRNTGANDVLAAGDQFIQNGLPVSDNFRIEDLIDHALDGRNGGVVYWQADSVFVSATNGKVQRGVDAVPAGGTVYVEAGVGGHFSAGSKLVTIVFGDGSSVTQQMDPLDTTTTSLVVQGTYGNDTIKFTAANPGIRLAMNQSPDGTFAPTGRLIVHGLDGGDDIRVASDITLAAWLFGGAHGNNYLQGGGVNDVLIGGSGNDTLIGDAGRDLLIGSGGNDYLNGKDGGDILIAGATSYGYEGLGHEDEASLAAVMAEWTSSDRYATRLQDLIFGGGLNGTATLSPGGTVHDAGGSAVLEGGAAQDVFFASVADTIIGQRKNENSYVL